MTQFQSDAVILDMKQRLKRIDVYIDNGLALEPQYQTRTNDMFELLHKRIETINEDLSSREVSAHERENYNSLIDEINVRIDRLRPYVTTVALGGRKKRKSRRQRSRRRRRQKSRRSRK